MSKLVSAGVFPVHNNKFEIGLNGVESSAAADFAVPAGLENFSPAFDNTIEEWYAMDDEGWASALLTGKKWAISFKGKRVIGDDANDYIAGLLFAIGQDANTILKWTMPTGTVVTQEMIVSVTNNGGGDTTNVGALEFGLQSTGKPTVTPAA